MGQGSHLPARFNGSSVIAVVYDVLIKLSKCKINALILMIKSLFMHPHSGGDDDVASVVAS